MCRSHELAALQYFSISEVRYHLRGKRLDTFVINFARRCEHEMFDTGARPLEISFSDAAAPARTVGWRKTILVTAIPKSIRWVSMAQVARVWKESMELR
jgi:hypothetical protein